MTRHTEDDHDEARLAALFNRTAELPSGPTLTKLSARAADIPARARRRPWWRSFGFLAPASAALAGVLAVLALPDLREPAPVEPVARTAPTIVAPEPSSARPTVAESVDEYGGEEWVAELGFADETPPGFALDPMYAPTSDAELDAWLHATETLLDEGG